SRFDFNTLFREFNILRETIFSVLEVNEPQISQNDRDTILNMFFVGFRDSGAAFADQQLEEQRSTVAELQTEREMRDRFVDTLTHDMRNPLTAAKTSIDVLERYG